MDGGGGGRSMSLLIDCWFVVTPDGCANQAGLELVLFDWFIHAGLVDVDAFPVAVSHAGLLAVFTLFAVVCVSQDGFALELEPAVVCVSHDGILSELALLTLVWLGFVFESADVVCVSQDGFFSELALFVLVCVSHDGFVSLDEDDGFPLELLAVLVFPWESHAGLQEFGLVVAVFVGFESHDGFPVVFFSSLVGVFLGPLPL